ncbi:hypothetical protein HOO65_040352 [Ceratocystis lukuohia]|uniref:Uncharacterized protein n=2 Tax=Ceratocystis TaxID=5157 RepID=A0A0F8BWN3_CERFI|nr:hypothetical protein CFO_g689 [Ceratocystis platani]
MPATDTPVATRDGKAAAADLNEPGTKTESSSNDFRPFWYCDNNHSFWFACHNDMDGVLPENPRCYCLFTTRLVQDGERFYYRCASAGCGYIIDYPVDIWPAPAMALEKGKEKLELISDDGGDDYFEDILGVVSRTNENGERIFQRAKDGPRLRAHSFGR